jgi:hypothetical protein
MSMDIFIYRVLSILLICCEKDIHTYAEKRGRNVIWLHGNRCASRLPPFPLSIMVGSVRDGHLRGLNRFRLVGPDAVALRSI